MTAPATGTNPSSLLPSPGALTSADLLGEHVSAPLSQFAKLILKVSYNGGADLMTCLAAAKVGSTDCESRASAGGQDGPGVERLVRKPDPLRWCRILGPGRTTPAALATFLAHAPGTSFGPSLKTGLPILQRDGTLANVQANSPAAGHAQVKTGNRVVGSPGGGQILVLGNSLAGYAQTKSGREVTFMIAVGNVPIATPAALEAITNDQARMIVAIQQEQ